MAREDARHRLLTFLRHGGALKFNGQRFENRAHVGRDEFDTGVVLRAVRTKHAFVSHETGEPYDDVIVKWRPARTGEG